VLPSRVSFLLAKPKQ